MSTWSGSCLLHKLLLRLHIVDHRDPGFPLLRSPSMTAQCARYISSFVSTSTNQERILRMITAWMPVDHTRLPLVRRAKDVQCLSRSHSFSSRSCSLSRMQRSDQFLLKMTSTPVYLSLSILRRSQSTQKASPYLCLKILLSSVTAFQNPHYRPEVYRCSCAVRPRVDCLASKSWGSVLCPCLSRHSPRIHGSQTNLISLE